jgi:hypothetical protein
MGSSLESLSHIELLRFGVWEFSLDADDDDTVRPVRTLPVASIDNRFIATHVRLANGDMIGAILSNLELSTPELNCHFLSISILGPRGQRFHLARYHDVAYAAYGPVALAAFLGLTVSEVFPIAYDVSTLVVGPSEVVRGLIPAEPPAARLSTEELIAHALR